MGKFAGVMQRIIQVGTIIACSFLLGTMMLIVISIITRSWGEAIPGAWELTKLLMVVTVAFSLGYTAAKKGHIVVNILESRLPEKARNVIGIFTGIICIASLIGMIWAGAVLLQSRWSTEQTDILDLSFAPFRVVWLLGLIIFCLVLLVDLSNLLKQMVKK
jgi:TRAP-type C4-dicarboxylate transport system permease small subunit